mgnify:FL=1
MKKRVDGSKLKSILLTVAVTLFAAFVVIPLFFSLFFDGEKLGNVALIPIEGAITGSGETELGALTVSSEDIVTFIEEADKNPQVKVLLLEINSPGGSAVASDEIASAVKKSSKPVVALIREAGASGGYWVASAADYVIANRMSITGSIGVLSSYLEFSGLMEKYGVGYEQLTAGEYKDMGAPFKKLSEPERKIMQSKLDKIHQYFIEEIAVNRGLEVSRVEALATGEFFLGVEALELGLVDALGDKNTAEEFVKKRYGLKKVDYILYQHQPGFLESLSTVFSDFYFSIGEGIGSMLIKQHIGVWM